MSAVRPMRSGFSSAFLVGALIALTACVSSEPAAAPAEGAADAASEAKAAPAKPEICFATDKTPARFETTVEQILVSPEVKDAAGQVVTPASYRSETKQKQISASKSLRFETPCAEAMTPELISNLQRALNARALYSGAIDGRIGSKLSQAIRSYQRSAHQIDSAILSMEAARSLGLIAYDRRDL